MGAMVKPSTVTPIGPGRGGRSRAARSKQPRDRGPFDDERPGREDLVRPRPPEHVPQPTHRLTGAPGLARRLAGLQGPLAQSGVPRAAVDVVPDRLARDTCGG